MPRPNRELKGKGYGCREAGLQEYEGGNEEKMDQNTADSVSVPDSRAVCVLSEGRV